MKSIQQLEKEGYVALAYPPEIRARVKEVMKLWKQFCSLPDEVKVKFGYSNGSAGVGYEKKGQTGPSKDKKENFDLALAGLAWLMNEAAKISDPTATAFVQAATALISDIKVMVLGFARQAEHEFGLNGFEKEVSEREDAYFIRFIHYFDDVPVGIETAEAHTDQSGFTLHLFESAPGLQYLDPQKTWRDMPVSEGETVIIPSMQLQLRSEGRLTATVHRVISNGETAQKGERGGRLSAVVFVQLAGPVYDKLKGRLQDLHKENLGFNYGMPHEEFRQFFKE